MSSIFRLAGAMIAQCGQRYYLVGDQKEPLDFPAHGFEPVPDRNVTQQNFVELQVSGPVISEGPLLEMNLSDEELAKKLSYFFLIRRNGSVSERLWDMVIQCSKPSLIQAGHVDGQWLADMPEEVWDIVRDSVLRC